MESNREHVTSEVVLMAIHDNKGTSNPRYRPAVIHWTTRGCVRCIAIATFVTVVVGGFPAMA